MSEARPQAVPQARTGQRLHAGEALDLYQHASTHELGRLAGPGPRREASG